MKKKYKILTFGASSSKNSINKEFAAYAASLIENAEIDLVDLNDFEMPIYSIDRERENGYPEKALKFKEHIKGSDGIIISLAEHNGAYTAAFKNILDWTSRTEKGMWDNKPMLLLSTSPGARGGQTVLEIAASKFAFMAAQIVGTFSLPRFYENLSDEFGIQDAEMMTELQNVINEFQTSLIHADHKAEI